MSRKSPVLSSQMFKSWRQWNCWSPISTVKHSTSIALPIRWNKFMLQVSTLAVATVDAHTFLLVNSIRPQPPGAFWAGKSRDTPGMKKVKNECWQFLNVLGKRWKKQGLLAHTLPTSSGQKRSDLSQVLLVLDLECRATPKMKPTSQPYSAICFEQRATPASRCSLRNEAKASGIPPYFLSASNE